MELIYFPQSSTIVYHDIGSNQVYAARENGLYALPNTWRNCWKGQQYSYTYNANDTKYYLSSTALKTSVGNILYMAILSATVPLGYTVGLINYFYIFNAVNAQITCNINGISGTIQFPTVNTSSNFYHVLMMSNNVTTYFLIFDGSTVTFNDPTNNISKVL